MRHFGGQCHCALFSEVCILGDAAFTREPYWPPKWWAWHSRPHVTCTQGVNTTTKTTPASSSSSWWRLCAYSPLAQWLQFVLLIVRFHCSACWVAWWSCLFSYSTIPSTLSLMHFSPPVPSSTMFSHGFPTSTNEPLAKDISLTYTGFTPCVIETTPSMLLTDCTAC